MFSKSLCCNKFSVYYSSCMRLSTIFVNYLKLPKLKGPTGEEIVENKDLSNKTCLITGGTSGIGVEMVRCLMARNCEVIMACRNPYAANVLSKNVWGEFNKLTTYKTNLASFASVKKASDEILENDKKIDIVILNAAAFGLPWALTEDGYETIFQVNYLSQFYLLMNIESILAPDARVVFMSSDSHRNLKWSIEEAVSPTSDLISLPKEKYTSIKAYNTSKLCGILAMHYFYYRWSKTARSIFCAHPGSFIKTNLCSNWWPYELLYTMMYPFSKSIAQAAATPLYCATSPELEGYSDLYFKDCKECEVSPLARDNQLAFRIADLSKSLITDRVTFEADLAVNEFKKKSEEIKPEVTKSGMAEHVLSA